MAQAVTAYSTPALSAADVNTTINGEARILDLRLAEVLGFDRTRNIRRLIQRHIETLRTFGEVCSMRSKPSDQGGRPSNAYWLSKRQALFIAAKSDTERAALVTVQMVEVFDAVTSGATIPVKAHRRRAGAAHDDAALADGYGCILIDGALVRFRYGQRPAPGHLGVVVRGDGSLAVLPIPEQAPERFRVSEPGFVFVDKPGPHPRVTISAQERVGLVGAVVPYVPRGAVDRVMPGGRVSERVLRTYASWLHMEYARLRDEMEPEGSTRVGFGLEITNPGYWYHHASDGEVLEQPSARAVKMLRAAGCALPMPPRQPKPRRITH